MKRHEANYELSMLLFDLIQRYPELRFSQILRNFGFVQHQFSDLGVTWLDEFYLEPHVVLDRVQKEIEAFEKLTKKG